MFSVLLAIMMQAASGGPAPPAVSRAPAPATVTMPNWIRRPTGEDIARYYPAEAARREVSGRATLSCVVTAEGLLSDCRIVEESPAGLGFGDAALKMAPTFKMRPTTKDGQPVAGGTVRIPMRFATPAGLDPLSAMYACYGQTAAAAEKDPANPETNYAFGFFAAQAAIQVANSRGNPVAFETGLQSAREGAARQPPEMGPSLASCLKAVRKPSTPPASR